MCQYIDRQLRKYVKNIYIKLKKGKNFWQFIFTSVVKCAIMLVSYKNAGRLEEVMT